MEPERVRPLMEDYYKKKTYSSIEIKDIVGIEVTRLQGKKNILYKVNGTYFVKTDDGYKIDWEATIKYNSVSLIEMRDYPNKEFEYRLYLINSSGRSGNSYFDCYYLDDKCYIFPRKNSLIAKKLQDLIPNDESERIVVKMRYVGKDDYDNWIYEITEILSENLSLY